MFGTITPWSEDQMSNNMNCFNPYTGVKNLFSQVSTLSSPAHASTITHELYDEENMDIMDESKYSPEYNRLVQLYGSHNFKRKKWIK